MAAARYGDEPQLLYSLEAEAPSCVDERLQTPLHIAAAHNQLAAAFHLLADGALMQYDVNGRTPLHAAVIAGWVNMTAVLLDAGASVELRDHAGRTALHYAARHGYTGLVRLLLQRGATVNAVDGDERTPLHHSVRSDSFLNATRLLAERSASILAQDVVGFTPLHYSCFEDQLLTTQFLVERGADIYASDVVGWSPLVHAAAKGHARLAEWIIVQRLRPRTLQPPDGSLFMSQDIHTPAFLGLPGWLTALVIVAGSACACVFCALMVCRRQQRLAKMYEIDASDLAIEEFISEVFQSLNGVKEAQCEATDNWDRVAVDALQDLHRVRTKSS